MKKKIHISRKNHYLFPFLFVWFPLVIIFIPCYFILEPNIVNSEIFIVSLFAISVLIIELWLFSQTIKYDEEYLYLPKKIIGFKKTIIDLEDIKIATERITKIKGDPTAYITQIVCSNNAKYYFRANYYSKNGRTEFYNFLKTYNIEVNMEFHE